jgi:cytoskeletal protein CcmA (bactofilin family)
MNCRPELDILMYLDRELPADEAAAFEDHLAACAHCRQRCDALRAEDEAIGDVLREAEHAAAPARTAALPQLVWIALALAALAVGLQLGLDLVAQLAVPFGWLAPSPDHQLISALVSLVFSVTLEDMSMLFTPIAALTLALLIGTVFVLLGRRRLAASVAGLLLLLVASAPVCATEIRTRTPGAGEVVIIPAGETINDSVIALGKQVIVEGTVTGDLLAAGEHVSVSGEVQGSLVALARSVSIGGVVKGDIYSAGQAVDVRGQVGRNVYTAANTLDIATGARIATDAWIADQYGRVSGTIGRDLHAAGQSLALTGAVDRAVRFSGQNLDLGQTARVGGEITANVPGPGAVVRAPSAQLASEPQIHLHEAGRKAHGPKPTVRRWLTFRFYFWQAVRIAAALALGLLLYWLVPGLFTWAAPPERHLLRHGGIGFLALVAVPVAAVVVSLTVIGLPIGILGLITWSAALYLAGIFVALMLGQLLLRSQRKNGAAFALALLVGLVVVRIAINLPFLGNVIYLLVVIVGIGMLAAQLVALARRLRAPAAL